MLEFLKEMLNAILVRILGVILLFIIIGVIFEFIFWFNTGTFAPIKDVFGGIIALFLFFGISKLFSEGGNNDSMDDKAKRYDLDGKVIGYQDRD
jgi:hypothetical protein